MKRAYLPFILGLLVGSALTGGIIAARVISKGLATWGALNIFSDKDVRAAIRSSGITIPSDAHDLYYAIAGFQDKTVWIKISLPTKIIWDCVEVSTKTPRALFVPGIPEHFEKSIYQNRDQNLDTKWWAPEAINRPVSWSRHEEKNGQHYFEDWVIDEEEGHIYITKWDT